MNRNDVFNELIKLIEDAGVKMEKSDYQAKKEDGACYFKITNNNIGKCITVEFAIYDYSVGKYFVPLRKIVCSEEGGIGPLYDLNKLSIALIKAYDAIITLARAEREITLVLK